MTETPVDFEGAFLFARQQHAHTNVPGGFGPTWHGKCQMFAHFQYGLMGGGFGSAYLQWLGLDPEDRHVTADLSEAPLGALLFSKGVTPYGHVWTAARPFASGVPASWSTDLWQDGKVGKVARNAPATIWGHRLLGWGTSVNGYALDLTHGAPPKPKQNKRYQRVERAIENLGVALDTARGDHDLADVQAIKRQIQALEGLYSKIRHT